MLPIKVQIGHFRALKDCTIDLEDNTIIVGQNGAGKSTVLEALRYFFEPGSRVGADDQLHGSDDEISVTVTLSSLNESEVAEYQDHLDSVGNLTVTKKSAPDVASQYYVSGMQFPGFADLRKLNNEKATVFTTAFKTFVDENPDYKLAKPRSMAECKAELQRWEQEHPDQLVQDEIEFEFVSSTKAQLIESTRLVYIPAVHEASDDFKASRSPLSQMIDALVIPQLEEKPEFVALQERWDREYQAIFPVGGTSELRELAATLSEAIGDFVPGAAVNLGWVEEHPRIPIPEVRSQLSEDGIATDIDHQGHGLQRAMIIALLQAHDEHLRQLERRETDLDAVVHILLLIEEPELYQHPPRARYFRKVLKKLSSENSESSRFRVVATTHSPNLVALEDIASIRIVRKEANPGGVPFRRIGALTLNRVIEDYAHATNEPKLSEHEIRKSLHVLDLALREAFFASAIVICEGASDIGVLSAEGEHSSFDLEAKGIVLASIGGKGLLPLAITILKLLGIRHYVVFDSDSAERLAENQRILRMMNAAKNDIPVVGAPKTAVRSNYAVLNSKIEDVVKSEFGENDYRECITEAASLFGRTTADVMKNPVAAAHVIDLLHARGLESPTLKSIIKNIAAL